MTLSELEDLLRLATPEVYEREAPRAKNRYIAWHAYNVTPIHADDQVVCELDRVQLDVFWPRSNDCLLGDVKRILNYFRVPYDIQDITWDDDRHLYRAILQLTAV